MTKYKYFLNFDKEEKWLEQMASDGWLLKKKNVFYKFEAIPPEHVTIRMDYRIFKDKPSFMEYRTLIEDGGWRHIAGSKSSGSQYFLKMDNCTDDDIFSDDTSRAGRYKRLSEMMSSMFSALLSLVVALTLNGSMQMDAFLNPKALYYTPGLWELSGSEFWRKFLFETPFVFMRGFFYYFLILLFLFYIFLSFKSWIIYKKAVGSEDAL